MVRAERERDRKWSGGGRLRAALIPRDDHQAVLPDHPNPAGRRSAGCRRGFRRSSSPAAPPVRPGRPAPVSAWCRVPRSRRPRSPRRAAWPSRRPPRQPVGAAGGGGPFPRKGAPGGAGWTATASASMRRVCSSMVMAVPPRGVAAAGWGTARGEGRPAAGPTPRWVQDLTVPGEAPRSPRDLGLGQVKVEAQHDGAALAGGKPLQRLPQPDCPRSAPAHSGPPAGWRAGAAPRPGPAGPANGSD